jgi:hypothetical protein
MFAKSAIKIGKRVGNKTQPCFNPNSSSGRTSRIQNHQILPYFQPFHTFYLVVSNISLLYHFSTTMQKGHLARLYRRPLIDPKKPNKEVFLKIYIGMQYPVKKIFRNTNFDIYCFSTFWFWAYQMKVIPETLTLIFTVFQPFDFERTRWRLFQKH